MKLSRITSALVPFALPLAVLIMWQRGRRLD